MVPPVALHDTAISALSPVAVKPTARKSSAWFCCRVTVCGDTTSCAMMEPRSVTGCSQLTTIVATATAATIATGSLSRASRRSEEHTSELQSLAYLVCRLLLEKKKNNPHRPLKLQSRNCVPH